MATVEQNRRYNERHPGRTNESRKRYREKNKERINEYRQAWRRGLTVEQFRQMKVDQGGLCAICRENAATHIDHDHETGEVRALLCHWCNTGLGMFREEVARLSSAISYIRERA